MSHFGNKAELKHLTSGVGRVYSCASMLPHPFLSSMFQERPGRAVLGEQGRKGTGGIRAGVGLGNSSPDALTLPPAILCPCLTLKG